jgi:phosphatidylglycerophosphatase A
VKSISYFISTFCFVGLLPKAPGTWASIAAAPLFYLIMDRPILMVEVLVGVLLVGVVTGGITEKQLDTKDPSIVVIDEVLGVGVAMLWIPKEWPFALMAVILFRIFDIWKPYPLRHLERLPGGWGIMLDDLGAGIYAWIWLQIGIWLIRFIA